MFFPENHSSELFLNLSEEQQETVAGGQVYENNKQYYIKTEKNDGGETDTEPQAGTQGTSIGIEPIVWRFPFAITDRLSFSNLGF